MNINQRLLIYIPLLLISFVGCQQENVNADYIKGETLYSSAKTSDRIESIQYFVKSGDANSYNALLKMLKDKNSFVKARAIRAIGELNKGKSIEVLLPYIFDNDAEVSNVATNVVKSFGSKTSYYIKQEILNGNNQTKLQMIKYVGKLRDKNLIDILGTIALEDNNAENRSAAIVSLSQLDDDIAWMLITKCFQDRNPYIVVTALKSMQSSNSNTLVSIIRPLLYDRNTSIVNEAIDALGRNKNEEAAYILIKKLKDNEIDNVLGVKITNALSKVGSKRNINYYISALNDESSFVRYAILKSAIDASNSQWSKVVILKASKNDNPEIRNLAILAMQEKDENLASLALIDSLNDKDTTVRANAIKTLAELPEANKYEKQFKKMLEDPDINVRLVTIRSIGKLREDWVFKEIRKILATATDTETIIACLESLGDYRSDNEVIEILSKYLYSDNIEISNYAVNSLIKMKSYKVKDIFLLNLKSDSIDLKLKSIYALEQLGDYSTVIALKKLTNDNNTEVKDAAKSAYDSIIRRKKIRDNMRYK